MMSKQNCYEVLSWRHVVPGTEQKQELYISLTASFIASNSPFRSIYIPMSEACMFWEVVREVLCLRLLQTAWGTGCVPRCHSHFMAVLSLLSQCFIYLHFILIKCVADHYVGKQTIKQQTNQNKQTKILFYLTTVTNRLKNVLPVGICLLVSIPTLFFFFFLSQKTTFCKLQQVVFFFSFLF